MRSEVKSGRWPRIIFTVCMGLTPSALALNNPNYNPEGQGRLHAAVWSIFQMQNECSHALARDPVSEIGVTAATEDFLNQLIGNQLPDGGLVPLNGVQSWKSLDDLNPAEREMLASRVLLLQDAFRADKNRTYIIGHAIKGVEKIKLYAKKARDEYAVGRIRVAYANEELQRKNRSQNIRSAFRALGAGAVASVLSYLGIETHSALTLFLGTPMATALFLPKPFMRLTSYIKGDSRFQRWFRPANKDTDYPKLLSGIDLVQKNPDAGFFMESEFTILSSTFEALRKGQEQALSELRRSCVSQSPSRKCEEYTGYMESVHLNDNSFGDAYSKLVKDVQETRQKSLSLNGRIASAYFHDSKTGEPIWISWLTVELDPFDSGKPKAIAQPEPSSVYARNLEPVPIPVRVKPPRRR